MGRDVGVMLITKSLYFASLQTRPMPDVLVKASPLSNLALARRYTVQTRKGPEKSMNAEKRMHFRKSADCSFYGVQTGIMMPRQEGGYIDERRTAMNMAGNEVREVGE